MYSGYDFTTQQLKTAPMLYLGLYLRVLVFWLNLLFSWTKGEPSNGLGGGAATSLTAVPHLFSGASSGSYDWTHRLKTSETWRETPLFTERLLCQALHFTFSHYSYRSP